MGFIKTTSQVPKEVADAFNLLYKDFSSIHAEWIHTGENGYAWDNEAGSDVDNYYAGLREIGCRALYPLNEGWKGIIFVSLMEDKVRYFRYLADETNIQTAVAKDFSLAEIYGEVAGQSQELLIISRLLRRTVEMSKASEVSQVVLRSSFIESHGLVHPVSLKSVTIGKTGAVQVPIIDDSSIDIEEDIRDAIEETEEQVLPAKYDKYLYNVARIPRNGTYNPGGKLVAWDVTADEAFRDELYSKYKLVDTL